MNQTIEITAEVIMSVLHHYDIANDLLIKAETEAEAAYYRGVQKGFTQLLSDLGIFITDINHFPQENVMEATNDASAGESPTS